MGPRRNPSASRRPTVLDETGFECHDSLDSPDALSHRLERPSYCSSWSGLRRRPRAPAARIGSHREPIGPNSPRSCSNWNPSKPSTQSRFLNLSHSCKPYCNRFRPRIHRGLAGVPGARIVQVFPWDPRARRKLASTPGPRARRRFALRPSCFLACSRIGPPSIPCIHLSMSFILLVARSA